MEFWQLMLIVAGMTGILGWFVTPLTSAVIYWCMIEEGEEINWGLEAAFTFAVPFCWIFAICEIILLYKH